MKGEPVVGSRPQPRVLLILPALNESETIVSVIESLKRENPAWDILVVDDDSQDDTARLAEATGRAAVARLAANLGIGGAVQTGFLYARDRAYDVAVQFDADGQHPASEVGALIAPIAKGRADAVIGSRFVRAGRGYRPTGLRRLGIRFFGTLNFLLTGRRIRDNTSGFRAYGRKAFAFLADSYPTDYPEPESVVLLSRNGFRIEEVPAAMRERSGGRSSIGGWTSAFYMIKVALAVLMAALRPRIKE
jgi:glycosyltransferase involved in cell wall biosynthesis